MSDSEWQGKRSGGDRVVGIVVGLGLVLVALILAGMFIMSMVEPEFLDYRRDRAIGPTPVVTLEDFEPFGAKFTDVAAEAGVTKIQASGATGERLLPETMGSGVVLGDLDEDGDADLLLLSYGSTPALYRNDSPKGGPIRFTDVTAGSGFESIEHSTTAALGDFDGDGLTDVYVGRIGSDQLLRNTGSMRFELDRELGDGWTSVVGSADIDGDHDLDLVVGSYVVWSPEIDREVDYTLDGIGRAYGPPNGYEGTNLALYVNDGMGHFTEESEERGLRIQRDDRDVPVMKALGMLLESMDLTAPVDIVIANDTTSNRLFMNDGAGHFTEYARDSSIAYDLDGKPTGAMGIDRSGFDHNQYLLVIGNFANEPSSVYRQQHRYRHQYPIFSEIGPTSGIGPATRTPLTFGTLLFDADLDGKIDVLQVNGHIEPEIARVQEGQSYRQRAQLFRGTGDNPAFLEVPADELGTLSEPIVGRAAASADLDMDGDIDLVISRLDGVPRVMRNDLKMPEDMRSVRIRIVGAGGNRHGYGVRIIVETQRSTITRMVSPTRSYMSQCDTVQVVSIGANETISSIGVFFPSGTSLDISSPPEVDGEIVILEPGVIPSR